MSLFERTTGPDRLAVADGAVWMRGWLPIERQLELAARCRSLLEGPGGGYVPVVRGGGKMHVQMMCLGRHWNARTYRYEATRSDHDGAPVAALPTDWAVLAAALAAEAGFSCRPDVCILNFYQADGRMGMHQDKDERAETLAGGAPVVSISLGDTARFLFGGIRRRDPVQTLLLQSGDVFVFGGPARLRYHGVTRLLPHTAPASLGVEGRFNLTFRQY
jgi:alkylated DNA repair protein (DNA oxidative demethylase)